MKERRQHHRRVLPFVRSAVLELEGHNHIVAVADISAEGAFLSTQVEVEVGELNDLGRDGWRMTAALPALNGVRMIFVRKL